MYQFIEALEGRRLFTATSAGIQSTHVAAPTAVAQPLVAAIQKITGTWNGTLHVSGVHDRPITITITGQTSRGTLSGTLTTSLDPSIIVTLTGRIRANRHVSFTLNGVHSGGVINGSGSGTITANGKHISVGLLFMQGSQGFPGSLTITRGGPPAPPPGSVPPTGGEDDVGGVDL